MVDIGKLIQAKSPNLQVPKELAPIKNEFDIKRLVEEQLQNVLCWAKQKGYDPRHNYVAPLLKKTLAEKKQMLTAYEDERAKTISEINEAGKTRIMRRAITLDKDGNEVGWRSEVFHEETHIREGYIKFGATPEQLCSEIFDTIYSDFDHNPITSPKEFDNEAFQKLHGRVIKRHIQDKKTAVVRIFTIKLVWKSLLES